MSDSGTCYHLLMFSHTTPGVVMATGDNGHNTGNTQTKLVDNLMATEKMADSDEASTPSLWTEHNFCKSVLPVVM